MRARSTIQGLLIAFCLALAPWNAASDSPNDILIIVNKNVPVDKLTIDDVQDLFLKRRTVWKLGQRVVPIHSPEDTRIREEFCDKVLNMALEKEKIFWENHKIRTGGTAPASFSDNLKAVFKLKGSISYIYRSEYREGVVKVVAVIPAR